jgi:AcrR family transcriptional regulator
MRDVEEMTRGLQHAWLSETAGRTFCTLGGCISPRLDVSEEHRNQILEAAMALFARQGFEEPHMDDIAQEVGLSIYFKSKDAIISAILQFFFSRAMKKLQGFLESQEPQSVREQLLRLNQ